MSVFVIADPGADHLGSIERMLDVIDAATRAGADAIKPQLYRADTLYAPDVTVPSQYGPEDLRSIIRRYEFPLWWLAAMKDRCDQVGIEFMCSAFSKELYDAVDPYVRRHKVASLEAGDLDLVRHVMAYGKQVIVSTGAATAEQVDELMALEDLTLLACTTAYPAPIEESDLLSVGTTMAGFSDHTRSLISGAVAAARGAVVVEKHIALGDGLSDRSPDRPHSLSPLEFSEYVRHIREAEALLGSEQKKVRPSEVALAPLRRTQGKLRGGG